MTRLAIAVKVKKYFGGLIIATKNLAFEVKATIGLESTHLENWVAKTGLKGPLE